MRTDASLYVSLTQGIGFEMYTIYNEGTWCTVNWEKIESFSFPVNSIEDEDNREINVWLNESWNIFEIFIMNGFNYFSYY